MGKRARLRQLNSLTAFVIILACGTFMSISWNLSPWSSSESLFEAPEKLYCAAEPDRGVLYFAYHKDYEHAERILVRARDSINSVRRYNPCMNVTVATNIPPPLGSVRDIWGVDHVIPIADVDITESPHDALGRQWWTRTVYLSKSPYLYTIQLDSDRTVCGDISPIFQLLQYYDFLGVSAGILPAFDNGVMAWAKRPTLDTLWERWKEELSKTGPTLNDQPPLARAIDALPGIRVGALSPIYQGKLIPAQGELWGQAKASRTLVLHGEAKIVAGGADYCESMNKNATRPRIFLKNYKAEYKLVFSQEECNNHLRNTCDFPEIDWELDFKVMARTTYINSYT